MSRSLFKTLLLLMLAACAVPVLLFAWLATDRSGDALTTSALELAEERVMRLRTQIASVLGESTRAVEAVVRNPAFPGASIEEKREALAWLRSRHPEIRAVTVFDANGDRLDGLQAHSRDAQAHEAAARALFDSARTSVFSAPRRSEARGETLVTLVVPLVGTAQEPAGYAAAELSLDPVQELLASQRFGARGQAWVVDGNGRLIAASDPTRLHAEVSDHPIVRSLLEQRNALAGGGARVGRFRTDEGEQLAGYAVIPEMLWGVIAEEPAADAFVLVRRMREQALWGGLVALLLAAAISAVLSRTVTRPLQRLSEGALEIARGRFGVQVDLKTNNELGALAQTFNYMSQQLMAYDAETRGLYKSLEEGYLETLVALANSIDSKDSYTRGHSQRVGDLAAEIGRELGLPEHDLRHLRYGGILHDIGKIGVSESILCKRTRLTDEEMAIMREHPAIGSTIIEGIGFLRPVLPAVRNHHERWDGTGYPDGLEGEEIPLIARIVNCADTWDACTSTRPYQKAMAPEAALAILHKLSGSQLDPKVVDALERLVRKKQSRGERVSAWDPSDEEQAAS